MAIVKNPIAVLSDRSEKDVTISRYLCRCKAYNVIDLLNVEEALGYADVSTNHNGLVYLKESFSCKFICMVGR